MDKALGTVGGIPVYTSPYVAKPGTIYPFADWRERLTRNLTRPTLSKWEPLHRDAPSLFLMNIPPRGEHIVGHPDAIMALILGMTEPPVSRSQTGETSRG